MSTASEKVMIEICPGLYLHRDEMREGIRKKFAKIKPGTYLQLDEEGFAVLGLKRRALKTLQRLSMIGEIQISKVAPETYLLNMESWEAHLNRTCEDPWYWDNAQRRKSYKATYEGGSWR